MTSQSFLDIHIPFSEANHCSVYFAHLQNTLRAFMQKNSLSSKDSYQLDKISHIIHDVYVQNQKLLKSYEQLSQNTKDMMTQFKGMLNQCKDDRENLMQATKDKYQMLQKYKESNQDATALANQNIILKQTIEKLKQINQLLNQRNQVTQEQLSNRQIAQIGAQSFHRISNEYDRLLESNTQVRKELTLLHNQSQALQKISKPMQIISNALKQNPKITDQIWQQTMKNSQIIKNNKNQSQMQQLKKQLYQFNFEQFLNKIKQDYIQ